MDSTKLGDDETCVRLLVKAPDQQIDDQIVQCKLDWTVAALKDHLARVYPSKPKHAEQKIIFSGQLLNDSMILKDVLQQYYNKDDRSFIVHLVCGGQPKPTSTAKAKTNIGVGAASAANAQSASAAAATATAAAAPSASQPTPVEQYYSQLNNQQLAWMQQAYAHYLTQYTQFMATQGIQLQSTSPYARPLNATAARANDAANNNNAEDNEDADDRGARDARVAGAAGAPAAGDANPVNNNNNNNNAAGDEAPGAAALNRDWLDIFDMLSRIVVLSSIVYFYSSPSRFLIVTFLGFAIYLIQGGFFRGQPAFLAENNNARLENNNQVGQNEVGAQAQAAQPAAAAPQPVQQAPRNSATAAAAPGGHGEAARTNVNEENERPGAWAFTWTFFSSFFASLIPDQPNVI